MEAWSGKYTKEVISRIKAEVISRPEMSRSKLSRKVCEWLQWKGIDGQWKEVNCRIELLKMERAGIIKLPEARPVNFKKAAEGEKKEFYWAERKCNLEDIGPVEVEVIESGERAKSRLWNKMMEA